MARTLSSTDFLTLQLMFIAVWFMCQEPTMDNVYKWLTMLARYVFYFFMMRGMQVVFLTYKSVPYERLSLPLLERLWARNRRSWIASAAAGLVLILTGKRLLGEDFPCFFVVYVAFQYFKMEEVPAPAAPTINYGTGMACSFFEGYLRHVIPSDGNLDNDSFVDKITKWESHEGVVLPVKKLLLVVTSSLYCPPDLRAFNRPNQRRLPQIEACTPLEELQKDVAGVKRRSYKNSVYQIFWIDNSHPPVYVVAECATPIHTLHGVINNHALYPELVGADTAQLVADFCHQLQRIVERSPACRGKVEIVQFDDSPNSGQYLPSVLLNKVRSIEPDYMHIIEMFQTRNIADDIERLLDSVADLPD